MPGENCAIFGCSTSRRHKGISIFKVPTPTNDANKKWSNELINVITRDRLIDDSLKKRIDSFNIYICELHFTEDQFWVYSSRKILKDGALPTLNLPKKSNQSQRSSISITKREEFLVTQELISRTTTSCYKSFDDFTKRILKLSLDDCWKISLDDRFIVITCNSPEHILPKYEIYVDELLDYCVRIFGWMLPIDHLLYLQYKGSFLNVSLSKFISHIETLVLCPGVEVKSLDLINQNFKFEKHVITKKFNYLLFKQLPLKPRLNQDEFYRSLNCNILIKSQSCCYSCHSLQLKTNYEVNNKNKTLNQPAKLNAPLKFTSTERIKLSLQQHRLKCKQLENQIEHMKTVLNMESEKVNLELDQDLKTLYSGFNQKNIPDFMKLFWNEQQKYIKASSPCSVKYHPMIIKFCLNLAAKSSSAYSDLRFDSKTGSGFLVLPSLRTLRDYKNYIHPSRGFNPQVINDLANKTSNFSSSERFVTILFDEMKVQEDLVWDKYSGELIGFVDLGDIQTNYATLKNVRELASYVLVFHVKSIVNPLSYSLATFATTGVTSTQLMPIFWKAVRYLESINLKVIAATADGASPNRKFFKMHKKLDGGSGKKIIYRTKNLFSNDNRFIFFFADVPHLIKTSRNCLSNSGSGCKSRYMWNSGFFLLWNHISTFYNSDLERGLKLVPKLTSDHVNLTPYSVMRVRLASQVLSETVGNVLKQFGPPEAAGTAEFCLMMDMFFDCLNVKNSVEHITKRKPFLKPYESVDDSRFAWLDNFLLYFKLWKESIDQREGSFDESSKSKMFISSQTYEGLQITVHSFKEVVKFLLENGVRFVFSERFCQDDLENYFGRQRAIGRRKDNPSIKDFGYNDNTIKSQFSVRPITGNIQSTNNNIMDIENNPLPKRKKNSSKLIQITNQH